MDTTKSENGNTNHKSSKDNNIDGRKNWLMVMVLIHAAHLIFNSYVKYGMVKTPLEVLFGLVYLITRHWWLYWVTLLCCCQHVLHVYIIEMTLAWKFTSENVGMTLHAINVFFLPTIFTVFARITDANPVLSRVIVSYIMYTMTKTWSFAFVNSKFRKMAYQSDTNHKKYDKDIDENNKRINYPNYLTIKHVLSYFIFTPPIQYQPCLQLKSKLNWSVLFKFAAKQFLVFYLIFFINAQFVFMELHDVSRNNDWQTNIRVALTIALPLNVIWLILVYVSTYKLYLPAYAEFVGMKDVTFSKDWWNAESVNEFWTKWNIPVYECLKYNVVIPLLKNGYSKVFSRIVAFMLAGLLHEYLNSLPMGIYCGAPFAATLLEIPAGHISEYVGRKYGKQYGNIIFWVYIFNCHTVGVLVSCQYNTFYQIDDI